MRVLMHFAYVLATMSFDFDIYCDILNKVVMYE